ncbi:prepilin-type N-terminal cleavage/methylation domain-containing protein [Solidesulfovibrio sp.]|uniref:type IV pilin protein n=1 Tax=Solidesulfovibrio sp. TaxID=2910990 RepID=UPI002B220BD0|nr:prepilin-type N-terminal cleavage/methylation domain-containing protein [Solidesulfovibrio sp.]MEA5087672.1 prepilin-type N-terminal cleavage/methylation domain-containing protein [Solidesulfovibrio sp.]
MVKSKLGAQGQQGFTLIEIIAVLVILGILAVVAVPKYFNMQDDARKAAAKGLVAAAQSQLSLGYANQQMNSSYGFSSANIPAECQKVAVSGNASVSCTASGNNATITGTVEGLSANGNWNSPEG